MRLSLTGWAVLAISVVCLATLGRDVRGQAHAVLNADFGAAFTAVAELVLVAIGMWTLLSIALIAAATRVAWLAASASAVTPAVLRDVLFAGAAGALILGPVSAATAAAQEMPDHSQSAPRHALDGLQPPDRPAMRAELSPSLATAPTSVVVESGDSLWSIAAGRLGHGATNAQISAAVRQWYTTNRERIGPDPDRILPGQHLIQPPKEPA